MAAHINITSALMNGITIPSGSEIDSIAETLRVEVSEVPAAASGEIVLADPVNIAEKELSISGDGPHGKTLTKGTVANPATMTITKCDINEAPNTRCTFSITASASVAFVDPGTELSEDVGAEPTIADLEIVGVEYSVAESLARSYEVMNLVLVGSDGTPAHRATVQEKGTVTINGRGDVPVGAALGSGGVAFKGCTTGKVVATSQTRNEKRADWNGYSFSANHYKSAA